MQEVDEMPTTSAPTKPEPKPGKVPILIDGHKYIAPSREMTGRELRALASPPIGDDRDLWRDAAGDLDELIGDNEVVELEPQTRFFTVPRVINPGR
jgi:hypothetical protein